jgi:hypothetical protein
MAGEVAAAGIGAGVSMIGMGVQNQWHKRQNKWNRKAQRKQYDYQRALNEQGHDLQYEMWQKTNYPAQLEMMRKAGLNPALMYGQAGATGTTGSQGGGSASGGHGAGLPGVDMSAMLMGAQMRDILASAKGKEIDNDIKEGKDLAGRGQMELEAMSLDNIAKRLDNTQKDVNIRAGEMGIKLQAKQIEKIELESAKLAKEIKLNFTEHSGQYMWPNLERFVSGEYPTETYIGAASAALTILPFKNIGTITKLFGSGKAKGIVKGASKMYDKFMDKARKLGKKKSINNRKSDREKYVDNMKKIIKEAP